MDIYSFLQTYFYSIEMIVVFMSAFISAYLLWAWRFFSISVGCDKLETKTRQNSFDRW